MLAKLLRLGLAVRGRVADGFRVIPELTPSHRPAEFSRRRPLAQRHVPSAT